MHPVVQHVADNWHKYGIAFLVLKELNDIFQFISKLKGIQETFKWAWSKITCLYRSIFRRS